MRKRNSTTTTDDKTDTEAKSVYETAVRQLQTAADSLGIDEGVYQQLSRPKLEVTVHFPVEMDNGEVQVFTGYRVQHNLAAGPGKGGIRYHPDVTLAKLESLIDLQNKTLDSIRQRSDSLGVDLSRVNISFRIEN